MKLLDSTLKKIFMTVIIAGAFLFLAFHFFNNRWQINPYDSLYRNWQLDSEQLVMDKIIDARANGIGNYNGMMLDYQQQIGLGGIICSVVDKIVDHNAGLLDDIPKEEMIWVNVILFCILYFFFLWWLYGEFGIFPAVVVYISTFFTYWLGFSVKNIYWMPWTMLFPLVATLAVLRFEKKERNLLLVLTAFVTVFIRGACGYEFISVVLVSTELPLIYYALAYGWGIKKYIIRSVYTGLGAIGGFVTAMFVNIALIAGLSSWKEAVNYLIFVSAKRTGYMTLEGFDDDVLASFEVPLSKVISQYWNGSKEFYIFGKWNLNVLIPVFFAVSLAACVLVYIKRKKADKITDEYRRIPALTCVMTVSLIGAFSWLVLAKGHCVHHPHIDYVLFSLPFTILGFAAFAASIQFLVKECTKKSGKEISS